MPRFPVGGGRAGARGGSVGGAHNRPTGATRRGRHEAVINPNKRNQPVNHYYTDWSAQNPRPLYTDALQPTVTFYAQNTLGGTMSVQVQWAHFVQAFTYYDSGQTGGVDPSALVIASDYTLTGISTGNTATTCPTVLDTNGFYVRTRAGDGSGTWGQWSSPLAVNIYAIQLAGAFYIDENVGLNPSTPRTYAAVYIDENVGVNTTDTSRGAFYVDENVGISLPFPLQAAAAYVDENVGPQIAPTMAATAYLDMNIDSSKHPTPHIWWIVPEYGETGWIFHVFGHGFGDTAVEFGGEVMVTGPSGQIPAGVITWERVASVLQQNEVTLDIRPGSAIGSQAQALLAPCAVTLAAGDVITWDEWWVNPAGTNLGFGLSFLINGVEVGAFADATTRDDNGVLLAAGTNLTSAYGKWLTRTFTVPVGMNGQVLTEFLLNSLTTYAGRPGAQQIKLRNVGVLDGTSHVAKFWAIPPSVIALTINPPTITTNGAAFLDATVYAPTVEIDPAYGLDSQTILPEHGHIVVSVPPGAETGPVIVRLTA